MIVPWQVQIQTVDYCNRKCAWCPNSKMQKSPGTLMHRRVFYKILSDFENIGFTGRFHLYLMADPLCDHRIYDLITITRKRFSGNVIFISTNGDGFTSVDDVKRLFDAGLSELAISYYDNKNKYLMEIDDPRVVHAPLNALRSTFYNRAGLVSGVGCINPKAKCTWLWRKAYINYRGDVVLCCSDYNYEVVMGNVMDAEFIDIFNCDKFNAYREAHSQKRGKSMPLCSMCNRIR